MKRAFYPAITAMTQGQRLRLAHPAQAEHHHGLRAFDERQVPERHDLRLGRATRV